MANYFKWLLFIPIFILILGTYILLANEALIIKQIYLIKNYKNVSQVNASNLMKDFAKRTTNYKEDLKSNRDSAYPYFLLGTGLLLFMLVLPKLTELSFSATNGFTLKVLQGVQESITEAKDAALAIEAKASGSPKPSIIAEKDLSISNPTLQDELKRLEESRKKIEVYYRLLETRTSKKDN